MKEKYKLFNNYFKKFNIKSKCNINKFHHTYRVVEFCKQIAESLKLSKDEVELAMTCGLLHDIARFKQIDEYNTFDDSKSFDHGDMGYEILIKDNFILEFVNEEEKELVLKSVKNHNKFELEENLNDKEILFCNIVRDADKLDIMVEQHNYFPEGEKLISDEVYNCIKNNRLVNNESLKNNVDRIVRTISFIFDLNFKYSFNYLEEKNIIDNKLKLLEANMDIKDIRNIIEKYIVRK